MPRNWDEHYSDPANLDFTPAPLLTEIAELLPPGEALDLACGTGRNSLYLASLGWHVTALDASPIAIGHLRERTAGLHVEAHVTDLESPDFTIEPGRYDLICDFFYLQRNLFPQIREGVKPGGAFIGAIHLFDDTPEVPPRNPAYLLKPGELRNEFAGWKIVFYSEAPESRHSRRAARIIARRA